MTTIQRMDLSLSVLGDLNATIYINNWQTKYGYITFARQKKISTLSLNVSSVKWQFITPLKMKTPARPK